jgi:hypothetical protein
MNQSTVLDALILELAKRGYSSRATDTAQALLDIIDGMDAAGETIRYRNYTYGSVADVGTPVGSGAVNRCIKDIHGNSIEVGHYSGCKTLIECTADKNVSGVNVGEETFQIYSADRGGVDNIDFGDGPTGGMTQSATRAQSSGAVLLNPSFTTATGSDGVDRAFGNWEVSSGVNFGQDSTNFFQNDPGVSTGAACKFLTNASITQFIRPPSGTSSSRLNTNRVPYFLIVRFRRDAADGTLTIRLGTQTEAITLNSYSDVTWHEVALGVYDEKGYYDNFKEDYNNQGVRVSIEVSGLTTGTVNVDDIILRQAFQWDGKYYLITSGQDDFLVGDTYTVDDSVVANTGRIQTTMGRLYGVTLPHASAGETYPDA